MKRTLAMFLALILALSLVACGGNNTTGNDTAGNNTTANDTTGNDAATDDTAGGEASTVANADKPLVWFNRQPSNSSTGELDMAALSFNEDTYYVGFDANQGAELQGQMIRDYIEANIDDIDRNGDGVIGYVLAIGDIGHNDSIARTRGNAINTWSASFGDQIDVIASNNDGMGMAMFTGWSKANNVPTFGYDANSDAVAAIAEGYGGTISQHADVQAYLTLRVLRNALDGVDIDTGIGTADGVGNVLSEDVYKYVDEERSYYALNVAVTAENYEDFLDSTVTYAPVSYQLDAETHPTKNVWLNIYNSADNFLGSTYQPLLQKYDDLLNLNVEYIGGDGQTEANITNRLGNPDQYDAFAINMVKTDNAASYTALLSQ